MTSMSLVCTLHHLVQMFNAQVGEQSVGGEVGGGVGGGVGGEDIEEDIEEEESEEEFLGEWEEGGAGPSEEEWWPLTDMHNPKRDRAQVDIEPVAEDVAINHLDRRDMLLQEMLRDRKFVLQSDVGDILGKVCLCVYVHRPL